MDEEFLLELDKASKPCLNPWCKRPRQNFPMAFSEDKYCSDQCRKTLGLDYPKK